LSTDNRVLILVVERNPAVQRLERYFSNKLATPSNSPTMVLSALEACPGIKGPAILVAEILVPALDGLSLCRAIKADAATSHILVLIFSHLHAEDRALEAGADAFLIKPLNEELLIETVERLVSKVGKEKGTR
jgi:CheY-like chemotaxis protein